MKFNTLLLASTLMMTASAQAMEQQFSVKHQNAKKLQAGSEAIQKHPFYVSLLVYIGCCPCITFEVLCPRETNHDN